MGEGKCNIKLSCLLISNKQSENLAGYFQNLFRNTSLRQRNGGRTYFVEIEVLTIHSPFRPRKLLLSCLVDEHFTLNYCKSFHWLDSTRTRAPWSVACLPLNRTSVSRCCIIFVSETRDVPRMLNVWQCVNRLPKARAHVKCKSYPVKVVDPVSTTALLSDPKAQAQLIECGWPHTHIPTHCIWTVRSISHFPVVPQFSWLSLLSNSRTQQSSRFGRWNHLASEKFANVNNYCPMFVVRYCGGCRSYSFGDKFTVISICDYKFIGLCRKYCQNIMGHFCSTGKLLRQQP